MIDKRFLVREIAQVLIEKTKTSGSIRFVLVFASIFLSSCGGSEIVSIKQVYASQHCAMAEAGIIQLNSQKEISSVLQKSFTLTGSEPEYPKVDYDQLKVFAIGLGTKPNSGYALSLIEEKAAIHDGILELSIQVAEPDTSAKYAQVLVNPCMVIAVPKGSYRSLMGAGMRLNL